MGGMANMALWLIGLIWLCVYTCLDDLWLAGYSATVIWTTEQKYGLDDWLEGMVPAKSAKNKVFREKVCASLWRKSVLWFWKCCLNYPCENLTYLRRPPSLSNASLILISGMPDACLPGLSLIFSFPNTGVLITLMLAQLTFQGHVNQFRGCSHPWKPNQTEIAEKRIQHRTITVQPKLLDKAIKAKLNEEKAVCLNSSSSQHGTCH